ncbi:No pollen germination related 1 [Heracleum sosnowskyi]|uniref:No pollen germination related 1 n=1 Tax=Heracleum sosnowskyi TaxID=360622 RepID=A0AAD8M982_9APIA|nr:No pollen germination related 1 [Heracleum sosnowskyi]
MLCACSGEQFKFEEPVPQSPESLATRDFSASGLSSRTGTIDWELSKLEDAQVDEAESTLKEALSLNYEEARALLGRLEYQRGNFDAALQVFNGIDIKTLSPSMTKAIAERTRLQPRSRSKSDSVQPGVMSLHSVSLLLEAILLKANSLNELGKVKEAARECKNILDIVDSALPSGMPEGFNEDCKLQEMLHKALELLPKLWIDAGFLDEAIIAYRRTLVKPWNLDRHKLANVQKNLAAMLLYGGVEASLPSQLKIWNPTTPSNNMEEAILLLYILMKKLMYCEIKWDPEIIDHLCFALSMCGQFESLAGHFEQVLPGTFTRAERWFFLALCYSAAGQNEAAINLSKKIAGCSESKHKTHVPSLLFGAKLCSQSPEHALEGIELARRVIELANHENEHFKYLAYRFLGLCYGNAARTSVSDSERFFYHGESISSLNIAVASHNQDPDVIFTLGLENAMQRNITAAFDNAMIYSDMVAGSSGKGWKLLALAVSAEQRFSDAETIADLAFDETEKIDQLELLRLKAVLQIAQEQPKQAIETYRILLSLIRAQGEHQRKDLDSQVSPETRLETEAWLDLAKIYSDLDSWRDAEICIGKAKSVDFYFPRCWHATGALFVARSLYKEALVAFSISLSIAPDYVPSIVSTAQVMMRLGSQTLPIARSLLMNALRLEPTNDEAWLHLGLICKKEGSLQQAADCFQAAHELKMSAPVQSFA